MLCKFALNDDKLSETGKSSMKSLKNSAAPLGYAKLFLRLKVDQRFKAKFEKH